MDKYFYVYKWFNTETEEIFYIGKGCRNRYKEISHRNKDFLEYYKNNPCSSSIIEYFDTEEEAFQKEHELILYYKKLGQAKTNLDDGGKGGCHFVWTDQMRDYMSKNNPMKDPKQRQRMSENNPMKNPEIAEKVSKKLRKAVIIDGIEYDGLITASKVFKVTPEAIGYWCRKGKNSKGQICFYKDKKQTKPQVGKPVIIDNKYFETIIQASEYLECSSSNLSKALREGKTTYKGHTCKYANQQPSQGNSNKSTLKGSTTNE